MMKDGNLRLPWWVQQDDKGPCKRKTQGSESEGGDVLMEAGLPVRAIWR